MDKKINDALLNQKRCNYVTNFMTKGLFYSELERFTSDNLSVIDPEKYKARFVTFCNKDLFANVF